MWRNRHAFPVVPPPCYGPPMRNFTWTTWHSPVAGLPALAVLVCLSCSKATPAPTAADVKTFLSTANETMRVLDIEQNRAGWVQQNFITDDTQALSARASQAYIDAVARLAKESTKCDQVAVSADERRQLNLLKVSLVMAAPPIRRNPRN